MDEDILGNVAAYMWACQYGIGLFEDRIGRKLDYNLVTEVGTRVMADDPSGIAREVHLWAAEDLCPGRCASCPKS